MKILITYSSGYGTTEEVSRDIGEVLTKEDSFEVKVESIDDVQSIKEYDCVILGSSVRADRPMANVIDFLTVHRFELAQKKVALFAVCLTANCESGREKVIKEYLNPVLVKYPKLNPVSIAAFGGKIDFDKLNPVMQGLMRRVLEKTGLPTDGSIDTRDWNYIRSWATSLIEKIR